MIVLVVLSISLPILFILSRKNLCIGVFQIWKTEVIPTSANASFASCWNNSSCGLLNNVCQSIVYFATSKTGFLNFNHLDFFTCFKMSFSCSDNILITKLA
jgi:hypothetical protein